MISQVILGVLAASLPAALFSTVPAGASVAPPAATRSTYDTTVDLLNRASRSDEAARAVGGWTVRITNPASPASRSARRLACCDAVRRAVTRTAGRTSVTTLAVDLSGGRYRALADGRPSVTGSPDRLFVPLHRTRVVRRSLALAERPGARWLSGSAHDPIPAMVPGELFADSAAGSTPSSAIAAMIGSPSNVEQLERVDTPSGVAYRGSVRRFGVAFRVRARFQGDLLVSAAYRHAGALVFATQWTYERPVVRLPARSTVIGARLLRAAYAFTALPGRSAAAARYLRHKIERWRDKLDDDSIRKFVKFVLRQASLQLGPADVILVYRVRMNPDGGRIIVHNRFGHRSRSITWDAAAQRLRVSPVVDRVRG